MPDAIGSQARNGAAIRDVERAIRAALMLTGATFMTTLLVGRPFTLPQPSGYMRTVPGVCWDAVTSS